MTRFRFTIASEVTAMVRTCCIVITACLIVAPLSGQEPQDPVTGRWDLTFKTDDGHTFPSWLEIRISGNSTHVGQLVGRVGSARPISQIDYSNDTIRFSVPLQWEQGDRPLSFEAVRTDSTLSGWMVDGTGARLPFTAVRAPALQRAGTPQWAAPVKLFDGSDLASWQPQGNGENSWKAIRGVLTNTKAGANIATRANYGDFKLHVEFRYPADGNSGIYLRGRYEVQVEDSYGHETSSHRLGGVYGFLIPNENAAKPAGEWQSYDITLIGRRVTIVLNGHQVICDQPIPGITGGALDSNEGAPGPILLQGDHGPVEYRNVVLTPAR
jgi:Domain of Unknown Function (DUF1080)